MPIGWLLKAYTFLRNLSKQISFALLDKFLSAHVFMHRFI